MPLYWPSARSSRPNCYWNRELRTNTLCITLWASVCPSVLLAGPRQFHLVHSSEARFPDSASQSICIAALRMGAGGSKVYLQADKPYYYTGDAVTGSVVFHAEQPITLRKIQIKVTGVETVSWEESRGTGEDARTDTYHGKHEIFKIKLPILNESTLQPGDYQWPFIFELPHNIPGSFDYRSGGTRAAIEYNITADCEQLGMLERNIKKTIKLEVLQRHKASPSPIHVTAEEPISYLCCFNKGLVGLTVTGETDSHLPGDVIRLKAHVDNKSMSEVPYVDFSLYQKIRLTTRAGRNKGFVTQCCTRHVHQRQTTSGGPVGAPAAPGTVSNYAAVLPLDRQLEATCNSELIQSYYELEVRAKTGCCLSEVVVRQPIMLNDSVAQPVELPPAIMPPQGWAPQVYPVVQFSVPSPHDYDYGIPPSGK